MYTFNTLTVGDREYGIADARKIIPAARYGLSPGYYGGRADYVGLTDTEVRLIIEYKNGLHTVIDTGVDSLESVPLKMLQEIATRRKIDTKKKSKDELISLLAR